MSGRGAAAVGLAGVAGLLIFLATKSGGGIPLKTGWNYVTYNGPTMYWEDVNKTLPPYWVEAYMWLEDFNIWVSPVPHDSVWKGIKFSINVSQDCTLTGDWELTGVV